MAFSYSSKEELSLPLSTGHKESFIELDSESTQIYELPAEDVNTAPNQQPGNKAPRPNKASRAFRHAQLAVNQFIQRRHRANVTPRRDDDDRLPLPVIELILAHLDIRDAAAEEDSQGLLYGARAPAMPCPTSAAELYGRLVYSRAVARRESSPCSLAWRLLGSCDPAARHDPASCVTWGELPRLLGPVAAEMRACLGYVAAFRSQLDLRAEGCDHWLDLSHLRLCVLRLTGYWPHDVEHDHEAWAFGLPEDLTRLLYPQGGRFDHGEMAMNLDEVIIGPGWERLVKLEGIIRFHQRYCS
ncbi:hypothetical protein INS49_001532 [Diaporthe citri]|uniref:uncharacterized protein n=1 Tax=Diaporthe citri TaxID=83186 RepID=UPI001C7F9E96|nr:uncharacterized protein INS49_001532 [Diaporthe citri]KAG6367344.1 hypothetical protein INS49_001532 [Diaporthe citri]